MRVVHIITRFIQGGADENTLITCNGQVANGHEVILVYGREWSKEMVRQLDPRVQTVEISDLVHPLALLCDLRALLATWRLFRRLKPDVVHSHTSKAGVIGRFAARTCGVPLIVQGVHILPFVNIAGPQRFLYEILERMAGSVTDAFVDVSPSMRDLCLENRIGTMDNHFVIESGMDLQRFHDAVVPDDDDQRAVLGDDWQTVPVVLFVGALEPRKRQVEFLDVFTEVSRQVPSAHLVIVGAGRDRKRLDERIDALGLGSRIHAIGFRSDVQRWMKRATVGVIASTREGLPRVVIQLAACGVPIVSTHLPGIDLAVKPNATGQLVPIDNLSAMTPHLVALLTRPELCDDYQRAAGQLDLSPWDADAMVRRIDVIYEKLASGRMNGPSGIVSTVKQ